MKYQDLTGRVFGRLTVLRRCTNKREGPHNRIRVMFMCSCSCGKKIAVRAHSLTIGRSNSCGCLRVDLLKTNAHKRKDSSPRTLQQRKARRTLVGYIRVLRDRYGLSYEDFQQMVTEQNNECAICGDKMNPPNVDHHHESNKVRELLCGPCNRLLGTAQEQIRVLEKAILYLRRHHGR